MKISLAWSLSLPLGVGALAAPIAIAAAPAPDADLAKVQAHLRGIDSMVADFSQTDRNGKVVTGTLTLKKPGRIRFQYEKGVPILIVGDGKALWFIDYSVRQKQRWPIGNSPLGVLINPDNDLARFAHVVPSVDPRLLSVEARDPKHPEYGRITLTFSHGGGGPGGLTLLGWVALDAQNNRTIVRLSNQRFGVPIAGNAFDWVDPTRRGR
ncbi:MAG: LolA family protein [Sphingomonas sp.]